MDYSLGEVEDLDYALLCAVSLNSELDRVWTTFDSSDNWTMVMELCESLT